jgi:uncharacterized coiled-coil protein SlyX
MKQQCLENDAALYDVQFQISEARDSLVSHETEVQREVIQRLQSQLDALTESVTDLTEEFEDVQELTDEDDASGEIEALFENLRAVSEIRDASAQRFRDLLRKQKAEIAAEWTKILEKSQTLRSIFIGWFDESVSPQEIRELFDRFGKIRSIAITPRDQKFCAHLLFETHQAAEKAIAVMDGLMYRRKKLLVVWNDEFVVAPQQYLGHETFTGGRTEVISTQGSSASGTA